MNARSIRFELAMEVRQVEEAVASIFHTILFHRSSGKFIYNNEKTYSIGTIRYLDVDCNFLDLSYVSCKSEQLHRVVNRETTTFSRLLRGADTSPPRGSVSLEFYQKRRAQWPFTPDCVPWEIWTVCCELIESRTEQDMYSKQERVVEMLQDKLVYVTDIINQHEYVPKMPSRSDVDLVFDTSYADIQPYLFKIKYNFGPPRSLGNTLRKLMRDTFYF